MDIMEVDEAQGLTAEMVRGWLAKQAPRIKLATDVMTVTGLDSVWTWPSGDTVRDSKMDAWLSDRVRDIAFLERRTAQDLLREMNPRMRPWPSEEAIKAHDGLWLCVWDETACMGRFDGHWFRHSGEYALEERDRFALYWPCDQHGQRVRWPEKDGVSL